MAKIKKDITLGAILNNIHGLGYELKLDDKAVNLINSIDTGTEKELNDFKSQIETFVGHGDEFNIKAREWGFEENVNSRDMVIAAFSQFVSKWLEPGFTKRCMGVDEHGKPNEYNCFEISKGLKTSIPSLYAIETDNSEIEVFVASNENLVITGSVLDDLELKNRCSLVLPVIDIESQVDYSDYFNGSKALIDGELYDIDNASTKAKVKLNEKGAEIKQMSKMVLSLSGCVQIQLPITILDNFQFVVAKKCESGYSVLFNITIEKSDFTRAE